MTYCFVPIVFFDNAIESTCGKTAVELFSMSFSPPSITGLGFIRSDETGTYTYFEREPHDADISVYRPEWGEGKEGQSVSFFDSDFFGYDLVIHYFAGDGRYRVELHENEKECKYDVYLDKGEVEWEYPDIETVDSMLSDVYGTKEKTMYIKPVVHFHVFVKERFHMEIDELYSLPER
jgi:hypothetical protein